MSNQKEFIDNNRICCRVCTLSSNQITFISIDANIFNNLQISDALRSLTNLEVIKLILLRKLF